MSDTTTPADSVPAGLPATTMGGAVFEVANVLKVGVGASGTFTALTGEIITVQNGIITNIF